LEINHIETLDYMDWEGEMREVKCSSTFVKEMDLPSSAHGLKEQFVHLESTRRLKLIAIRLRTCEVLIQKLYEGCADTA
jgi:hypothetical protein